MDVTTVLPLLQVILTSGNICVLAYALFKFLKKPHTTLESRLELVEHDLEEIKGRLLRGNDKFREQEETNQVLLHSVLALIEFEMQYCIEEHHQVSAGLEEAKKNLQTYLTKR